MLPGKLSRSSIGFSLHHPRLAFLLLTGRLRYEEVLQELISQDLQLLRNRIGSIPHWRNILELPQESIEEVLRLVIPGSQESRFGKLNRWHAFLYAITNSLRPKIVVETGVLYGHSSAAVLGALEDNGTGVLVSLDLPTMEHQSTIVDGKYIQVGLNSDRLSVGCAVPLILRSRWSLRLGNSLDLLPKILGEVGPISMFIHDSLHRYDHMMAEFHLGYNALEPRGVLVSDDIGYNSAWSDFCESNKENWKGISKYREAHDKFAFLVKSQ